MAKSTSITVDHPAHGDEAATPPHLKHYFVSSGQQFSASKLGMWLFLLTEILLFGGMFVAYGIYRSMYPELFAMASTQLDTMMGATNTMILLLSSLTMAWSIRAIQMDNRKLAVSMLISTILLAFGFMVVKYFEYTHKFELGIYPGAGFVFPDGTTFTLSGLLSGAQTTATAAVEQVGAYIPGDHGITDQRAGLFFSLYFVMTGIHTIHVVIGIVAISFLAVKMIRGKYSSAWYTSVENVGLYWHLVDIIWIFLFPLMYLI